MILTTRRLELRPWNESDAEELFKYAKEPDVGLNAGWKPHVSVSESIDVIRTILSRPEMYAVCFKGENEPIGSVGLHLKGHTDLTDKDDECELGYWLGKPFWGRGIMPEAANEMLRHAFEDLGMSKVWAGYYDGNDRSKRVQEKCGFIYQWTTQDVNVPALGEKRIGHVSAITKEAWSELMDENDAKKARLYYKQKELLDTFLKSGAITQAQYDKSFGDLTKKMGFGSK